MKTVESVNELIQRLNEIQNTDVAKLFSRELLPLLELLEKVNPCGQRYEVDKNGILISYFLKLNLFNFIKLHSLKMKVQVIGIPASISSKGYWGNEVEVEHLLNQRKGLKILLNGNSGFTKAGRTLSSFIFENKYASFNDYMDSLRSPYRRRVKKALLKREKLLINKFDRTEFTECHYELYKSVMDRTKNPLEILPMDFFRNYEAELYEFIEIETKEIIGFIQLKELGDCLYFLFGGFKKEDNSRLDIYYNMLLKIVEAGIEKKVGVMEFGQTAEESKMKIGCKEVPKYLYVHHSNPILNWIIQGVLPLFSYRPYKTKHQVFKEKL